MQFFQYESYEWEYILKDGDKVYRTLSIEINPDIPGQRGADQCCFQQELTFVASINVDKKFKVYYNWSSTGKEWVAAHRLKLFDPVMAKQLFPGLVSDGYEFIV